VEAVLFFTPVIIISAKYKPRASRRFLFLDGSLEGLLLTQAGNMYKGNAG
jgi:hypothetical protein